jgi:hypothetical protein
MGLAVWSRPLISTYSRRDAVTGTLTTAPLPHAFSDAPPVHTNRSGGEYAPDGHPCPTAIVAVNSSV